MQKLIHGHSKFKNEIYTQRRQAYQKLAEGQNPEALFITCSDSRIDPNLITGTAPGDMFILRNVGNLIPPHGWGEACSEAVIEYAVVALGVKDIVVCGHSNCGAMKAILHPEHLTKLPSVAAWLVHAEETKARVQQRHGGLTGIDLLNAAIRENVLVQLERLKSLPSVAPRLADGSLDLHGWVYNIGDGEVVAYDRASEEFRPIAPGQEARSLT
jgi:carbonic anhydrase